MEFARLEAAGVTTEVEMGALREQFEIAVVVLECWVEMNVELLASFQDISCGLGGGRTWAAVREWPINIPWAPGRTFTPSYRVPNLPTLSLET